METTMSELIWRGTLRYPGRCSICDEPCAPAWEVKCPTPESDDGQWACRECLLEPDNGIAITDERGDVLYGNTRERHLDAVIAMSDGPLEDHVSQVLSELAVADTDFDFGSMLKRWQRSRCLTPKQMTLVQWRLKIHDIDHDPSEFRVSMRSKKEQDDVLEMEEWKRERLLPYLTEQQKTKLGI
jgi:hypothetical protein